MVSVKISREIGSLEDVFFFFWGGGEWGES